MTISCSFRHRPQEMHISQVVLKDGTTEQVITCPKCFRTVQVTAEIGRKLEVIRQKEQQIAINTEGGEGDELSSGWRCSSKRVDHHGATVSAV